MAGRWSVDVCRVKFCRENPIIRSQINHQFRGGLGPVLERLLLADRQGFRAPSSATGRAAQPGSHYRSGKPWAWQIFDLSAQVELRKFRATRSLHLC